MDQRRSGRSGATWSRCLLRIPRSIRCSWAAPTTRCCGTRSSAWRGAPWPAALLAGGPAAPGAGGCAGPAPRLIDWEPVRGIARRRLGPHAAPLSARERAEALAFYQAALSAIEPSIQAEVGRPLPQALEIPAVIDRLEWIDLNLATFRALFSRVEVLL